MAAKVYLLDAFFVNPTSLTDDVECALTPRWFLLIRICDWKRDTAPEPNLLSPFLISVLHSIAREWEGRTHNDTR